MKLYKSEELNDVSGDMMLIYGETGAGKSVSIVQTAPDPILYIMAEPRAVQKILAAAARPNVKIKFGFYTSWNDLIEFVNDPENFKGFKTIVIDSLTHIMAISLSDEILEENYEAYDNKKKLDKDLTMRVKMSVESYGTLSGQMLRFTNAISKLSQDGHIVICIARMEQNPKFDRSLAAAPALRGKEYVKYLPGFCDFLGYVESRTEDGKVQYPPYVSFEGDGSFMAKWTGVTPNGGTYRRILNIEKILQAAHGKSKKGGVNGKERTIGENSDV